MISSDIDESVEVTWRAMASILPPAVLPDADTRARRGRQRAEHLLATDPGGNFVAIDDDGAIVGLSMALVRDGVWVLSQLAVLPEAQSRQIGRKLIDAALQYGNGVRGRLIASSQDPRAMRRYRRAGLDLLPCVCADGALIAASIPDDLQSRRARLPADQELCDRVSRHVRGAAHGPDVGALLDSHGDVLLVHDDGGWAVARDGAPMLLAAVDEAIAYDLLWSAFASGPRGATVHVANMTSAQQWAIDVCLAAGLALSPDGPLFASGEVGPLAPYLPSGPYL
jgi:GNAT superfamily N-acetyltransferase